MSHMVDQIADQLATPTLPTSPSNPTPPASFGVVGTKIFTHSRPATPDSAISLHQFTLGPTTIVMDGTVKMETLGLQIQCRETTDQAAEDACYTVFNFLNGKANVTLGGTLYYGFDGKKSPQKLRVDDEGRAIFYCEFEVLKAI